MPAPNGTVWGSIVTGSSSGRKGKLGIYTSITNSNTETSVNVQIWFATIYSCSDGAANTLYCDIGMGISSASTAVASNIDITHTVATGTGWNTANQTCLLNKTYKYSRNTSAKIYNIYAKFSGIDMLGSPVSVNTSFTVPKLDQFTLSYDSNGSSSTPPSSVTKYYGVDRTVAAGITRSGYSFKNWNTKKDGSGTSYKPGDKFSTNADTTLYAQWTPNTYTITYDANGNGANLGNVSKTQTKTHGVTLKLDTDKPTRTNYTFLGWATSKTATTPQYDPGDDYTANTGANLYAVWELAYTKPRIDKLSVSRCNLSGDITEDGTSALISFDYACDQAISSITVAYESVAHGSGSTTISATAQSGSVSKRIFAGKLNIEGTYTITLTVTDANGYSVAFATVSGTAYAIDFLDGGKGAAFGKPAEIEDVLDIAYKTRLLGGMMPVMLAAETDLNTVLIPGTYTGENITNYNYVNCPVTSGTFTLLVESCGEDGQVRQTYSCCSKYKPERYSRFYYQGSWGAWFWANTDEYILYEDESGTVSTVTLAASLSHFRYVEIYFTDNNGKTGGYTKVWKPDGKTAMLQITEASGTTVYSRQTPYKLSGTSLTPQISESSYYRINNSNAVTTSFATNYIKIVRVIGRA